MAESVDYLACDSYSNIYPKNNIVSKLREISEGGQCDGGGY